MTFHDVNDIGTLALASESNYSGMHHAIIHVRVGCKKDGYAGKHCELFDRLHRTLWNRPLFMLCYHTSKTALSGLTSSYETLLHSDT